MKRPKRAAAPGWGSGADGQSDDLTDRRQEPTFLGHVVRGRAAPCATCNGPRTRPLAYIGTPARQVAGQILAGDKTCDDIAADLVDVLGTTTGRMLAEALTAALDEAAS